MDFKKARYYMVEQQVRTWDVLDEDVLEILRDLPREKFIPTSYEDTAYADTMIPIGNGQVALSPKIVGRIAQALDIQPSDKILEIGTGTGYLTAVLAKLGSQVFSLEIHPELSEQAARNLKQCDIHNVQLQIDDGIQGYKNQQPYDVIVITGSVPYLPHAFGEQLKKGGRLFAVIGEEPVMKAIKIIKHSETDFTTENLFETNIPILENAPVRDTFIF